MLTSFDDAQKKAKTYNVANLLAFVARLGLRLLVAVGADVAGTAAAEAALSRGAVTAQVTDATARVAGLLAVALVAAAAAAAEASAFVAAPRTTFSVLRAVPRHVTLLAALCSTACQQAVYGVCKLC